ncbi:MAG: benzoyl-CoA reductase subunit D [Proteobacteria bacterium]|nr:benzoyl-CoA reductase subunit D [Pseudomonadota bacterium]
MFYTVGIDVGCNAIKAVLMQFDKNGGNERLLAGKTDKIRKRDIKAVIKNVYENVLTGDGLQHDDIAYVATTGEGELVDFRRGHFYSMTSHARGAIFLNPEVRALIDCGALHSKAMLIDRRSKVLSYRMTSQCASGSGQFLENIARYLGVGIEDIGALSLKADNPEIVSGICAVLAETDVINMVSRKITTPNILKGIHISMAKRLAGLLRMVKAEGDVLMTGGLAMNAGFLAALQELADSDKRLNIHMLAHEKSQLAGALGAALWGAYRHTCLREKEGLAPPALARAS